jgi:hypothetical protein
MNAPRQLKSTSVPTRWKSNWSLPIIKEHFVAALATINMLCPLQLWDEFLAQVELMLNLLCFSHCNPLISANHKLYSPFDLNKMPLAPLGQRPWFTTTPPLKSPGHSMLLIVST